ncbi:unnamed protein product [Prorocentrum cordatum]|uniref:Uncharacterized protein n=1 Tax=Prorocentrum cordatum TaxID=2364126 RepID=A0ABN9RR44_9DINO|nr:unnamed protein product [Polarella glacialis]
MAVARLLALATACGCAARGLKLQREPAPPGVPTGVERQGNQRLSGASSMCGARREGLRLADCRVCRLAPGREPMTLYAAERVDGAGARLQDALSCGRPSPPTSA